MKYSPAFNLDPDGRPPITGVILAGLALASYRCPRRHDVTLAGPLAPFAPVYADRFLYDIDLPATEFSRVEEVRC